MHWILWTIKNNILNEVIKKINKWNHLKATSLIWRISQNNMITIVFELITTSQKSEMRRRWIWLYYITANFSWMVQNNKTFHKWFIKFRKR